jgi:hypothetical protein
LQRLSKFGFPLKLTADEEADLPLDRHNASR